MTSVAEPNYEGVLRAILPVSEPLDFAGIRDWCAPRCLPGIDEVTANAFARTVVLPRGAGVVRLTHPRPGDVLVEAVLEDAADLGECLRRVARMLDLTADPTTIDAVLQTDERFAGSVASTRGMRLPGTLQPHEMVARAIIGQQVSVRAAHLSLAEIATCGQNTSLRMPGHPSLTRLFPSAARIASEGADLFRGPATKREALREASAMIAAEKISLAADQDPADFRERIETIRGVGPWTSGYLAMRLLGAPDIWLAGDVALRSGARKLGLNEAESRFGPAALTPYRSYAAMHAWRASAPARPASLGGT